MNAKPTPGPWLDDRSRGSRYGAAPIIVADQCWRGNQTREIAKVLFHGGSEDPEVNANAVLIVAAVNACFSINPENPIAVAEALSELVAVCKETSRQLEGFYDKAIPADMDGSRPRNKLEIQLRAALAKVETKP